MASLQSSAQRIEDNRDNTDNALRAIATDLGIELPTVTNSRAILPSVPATDVRTLNAWILLSERERRLAYVIQALAQRIAELEQRLSNGRGKAK
jgi:hypothetical protein